MPDVEIKVLPRELIGVDLAMDLVEFIGYSGVKKLENQEGEPAW